MLSTRVLCPEWLQIWVQTSATKAVVNLLRFAPVRRHDRCYTEQLRWRRPLDTVQPFLQLSVSLPLGGLRKTLGFRFGRFVPALRGVARSGNTLCEESAGRIVEGIPV